MTAGNAISYLVSAVISLVVLRRRIGRLEPRLGRRRRCCKVLVAAAVAAGARPARGAPAARRRHARRPVAGAAAARRRRRGDPAGLPRRGARCCGCRRSARWSAWCAANSAADRCATACGQRPDQVRSRPPMPAENASRADGPGRVPRRGDDLPDRWPGAGMVSVGMCRRARRREHHGIARTEGGRVTQVGEGHETAADEAGPVMTFGAPTVGEILAERYQLEEHVNNDSAGRQVWRGIDVILRRPVAVVLRLPGRRLRRPRCCRPRSTRAGSSTPTWSASTTRSTRATGPTWSASGSTASRCASWSPRRARWTRRGPPRSRTSIADALAAVHATGMVHGNVHPGTTLIGDDGRVVLADARADSADSVETDVRAVGGILYFALTGHWPHAEVGPLRAARRDPRRQRRARRAPAGPRRRPGLPRRPDHGPARHAGRRRPTAEALAAELARLDSADERRTRTSARCASPQSGTLGRAGPQHPQDRRSASARWSSSRSIGLVFGIKAISDSGDRRPSDHPGRHRRRRPAPADGRRRPPAPAATPKKIPLTADRSASSTRRTATATTRGEAAVRRRRRRGHRLGDRRLQAGRTSATSSPAWAS